MIKASDLRVCNLILVHGEISPVLEIHGLGIVYQYDVKTEEPQLVSFEEIEPIRLNEDWLERAGFKGLPIGKYEDDGNWHFQGPSCVIAYDDRWDSRGNELSYNGVRIWRSIKYVHELQNFFFALLAEELTIKPASL